MILAALCLLATAPVHAPAEGFDAAALAGLYGLQDDAEWRRRFPKAPRLSWEQGQVVMQGFFGASTYDNFRRTGGSGPDVDGFSGNSSQTPVIGGGGQWKLGGTDLDFGLEAMFSFSGRANLAAFAFGGGGATIAISVDLLVFELYGGPFVSCFLGDSARVYASAGPLMQWVDYSEDIPGTSTNESGEGFGTGTYARAGIEFAVNDSMLLGLGVRWSQSTVDLGYGLGELSMDGFQFALTISEGF